MIDQGEIIKN